MFFIISSVYDAPTLGMEEWTLEQNFSLKKNAKETNAKEIH